MSVHKPRIQTALVAVSLLTPILIWSYGFSIDVEEKDAEFRKNLRINPEKAWFVQPHKPSKLVKISN